MSALLEHVNGTRGRAVPALPEHTFKDSGITIKMRKVGPATQQRLAQQVQREYPKPAPPVVETELGPEENAADPAYVRALNDWSQQQAAALNERLMRFAALEADITLDDADRARIARTRRHLEYIGAWEDDPKLSQEENDRILYVLHIACATVDDLREFIGALMARGVPTEEAVQRQIATFPGDIPGPRPVQLPPDTAIGDSV